MGIESRHRMNLSKDQRELLSALNEHGAKYLVIGGYAVGFHTEPRATKDLDVFVRGDAENSELVFRALAAFGAPLAGMGPEDFRDGESFFQMGTAPNRIDILQHIEAVDFDEGWADRVVAILDAGLPVSVMSVEKLIRNKKAVGRLRDLADVEAMQEAAEIIDYFGNPEPG